MTDSRNIDQGSEIRTEAPSRRQRAIDVYGSARERFGGAGRRAGDALDEAPLIALAGGLAAGALVAALIPRTRTEQRLLRPVADRARETARSATRAAKEAGQSRLNELGLTRDKGADAIRSLFDGARDAARASADAAVGSVKGK
jgi:hypothetical protein